MEVKRKDCENIYHEDFLKDKIYFFNNVYYCDDEVILSDEDNEYYISYSDLNTNINIEKIKYKFKNDNIVELNGFFNIEILSYIIEHLRPSPIRKNYENIDSKC